MHHWIQDEKTAPGWVREIFAKSPLMGRMGKEAAIIDDADVVCSTIMTCRDSRLKGRTFDNVCVDEAGQLSYANVVIGHLCSKRLVLVGDPRQLRPIITNPGMVNSPMKVSMLDLFMSVNAPVTLLTTQYRLPTALADFISDTFYSGRLVSNSNKVSPYAGSSLPYLCHPISILVDFGRCQASNSSQSFYNDSEAKASIKIAAALVSAGVPVEKVTMLCPYLAQRRLIIKQQTFARQSHKSMSNTASIDSFQGS